ncbi:oligoribonuclease [Candidatus Riesia sp. GBBU]|nr:oligoribonuclease [Candidatus Riesia sp. GBBU]
MSNKNRNLIWIDLEMTGLDPDKNRIIEIATIVTDENLSVLCNGLDIVINQSNTQLSIMDKWNINTHTKNGLIEEVKSSVINEKTAENFTISFLKNWVNKKCSPMCGNNVYQDRLFLKKYMPSLEEYFHYRYIDVSSIKELLSRWNPDLSIEYAKKYKHRALSDIKESILELNYYRNNFIKH